MSTGSRKNLTSSCTLDSLSNGLASLFKDQNTNSYKHQLLSGFKKEDRYFLLKRNISFQQYKQLRTLPLVRLGKDKSGFIAESARNYQKKGGIHVAEKIHGTKK